MAFAFVSWWVAVVFAVLTMRAALAPRTAMRPVHVGIGELVLNTVVVVVALLTV